MPVFSRPSQWLYQNGSCYELGHAWHPSCIYSAAEVFYFVFCEALKIYTPLYLVSLASMRILVTTWWWYSKWCVLVDCT